tara:strand:+ start:2342 stop:3325 length:984 start_codon:yes stop_codon:yes gene_type:complete
MVYALYLAGFFMLIATLLPLCHMKKWWVRGFDFPRPQVLFISFTIFILFLITQDIETYWDVLFLMTMILIMLIDAIKIAPYTPYAHQEVPSLNKKEGFHHLTLLTVNVLQSNRCSKTILKQIETIKPDLLILIEIDDWWEKEFEDIKKFYNDHVSYPQENQYGMMLFSKFKLESSSIEFLVSDENPSIHTRVKLDDGTSFKLICVHPEPPTPPHIENDSNSSERRDLELILVANRIKDIKEPVIVAGDLNDVAWSKTTKRFQQTSGLLDPRRGRGLYNSFHAKYFFLRFPLDHIFVSKHFLCEDLKRLQYIHSDHFPIYAKFALKKH